MRLESAAPIRGSDSTPAGCSRNARIRWAYPWILASLCFIIAGCSNLKVKLPTSDSTPPSLTWNVFHHATREQADHPGSPTIHAKRGDSCRILLKAKDPEGVKTIQINPTLGGGEMTWQCASGDLAKNMSATLGPITQNLAPDANGMVLTSIFLAFELDFSMDCPAGWSFASGSAQLTGRAGNYFGGVTTEVIKFAVNP